jgi:hypothetical protein
MQKRVSIFFMCALFAFSLFGCSNITLQTVQGSNGNIACSLSVDATEFDYQERQVTYEFVQEYATELFSAYKTNVVTLFSNIYDYQTLGLSTDEEKLTYIFLYNSNYDLLAGSIEVTPTETQFKNATGTGLYDTLTVSAGFVSVYAYMMFFCPKAFYFDADSNAIKFDSATYSMLIDVPITPSDYQKEESVFMTTYLQTCVPFSYNGEEPKLLENYLTYSAGTTLVTAICDKLGLSEDEANYVYQFVTPFSRVHSNGTESTTDDGYVHTWTLGADINAEVIVWRNYSNSTLWYVLSLGAGLVVVGVGFLVIMLLKKRKNKNAVEALKKIDEFENKN